MKKRPSVEMLFTNVEPPRGLFEAVRARIAFAKRRSEQLRAGAFGFVSLVCALALVPAVQYALAQLYASGFYDYSSLLFSDSSFVLAYWREFSLTLISSLPALALLVVIPLAAALVWSLKRTIKTARSAFTYA